MTIRVFEVVLVRVIDGDTIDFDVDLGFRIWSRQRFRLAGIDTPERGEAGWAEATAFTREWFAGRPFGLSAVTQRAPDSFDRWVADIRGPMAGEVTLNTSLVGAGHAVPWPHRKPSPSV